uniref:Uncharacterized protein n=1 Tax=Cacopsylla melanoneura TaxID=428564 RepID=A0A8D8Y1S9_9HEMI
MRAVPCGAALRRRTCTRLRSFCTRLSAGGVRLAAVDCMNQRRSTTGCGQIRPKWRTPRSRSVPIWSYCGTVVSRSYWPVCETVGARPPNKGRTFHRSDKD